MVDPLQPEPFLDRVHRFQNGLVTHATGGGFDGGEDEYQELRREMMSRADLRDKIPDFVRRCGNTAQFWQFIKYEFPTYRERREFIWEKFRPIIDYLEANDRAPGAVPIGENLEAFDPSRVHAIWQKALNRRESDPEGAITAARTLLETVCKYILDDRSVAYAADVDLPKLWGLAASTLNLAPHQHQEEVFKAILGNCQSVVNNIAAIRNKIGDSHGTGRQAVRPKPRHAELAVNLAGSMASFLVATHMERSAAETKS